MGVVLSKRTTFRTYDVFYSSRKYGEADTLTTAVGRTQPQAFLDS
jgi:hypothetical protein